MSDVLRLYIDLGRAAAITVMVAALSLIAGCDSAPPPQAPPPAPAGPPPDMTITSYCDEHGVRIYIARRTTAPNDTSIAVAAPNGSWNGCRP